jgi:hypothetical protein
MSALNLELYEVCGYLRYNRVELEMGKAMTRLDSCPMRRELGERNWDEQRPHGSFQ